MNTSVREWALRLVMLLVSSLVAILGAEGVSRIVHPIWDGRDNVTMEGVPIKSWFEPGSVYRQLSNEYDAVTSITSRGHRGPGDETNPETIFIGDSFTYGWGLSDDETFASIYCRTQRRTCANLGAPGTGTTKQLDRLEDFLDTHQWRPREVKLFFFAMSSSWSAGNDFVDNYNERGLNGPSTRAEVRQPDPVETKPAPRASGLKERVIGLQTFILGRSNLMRLSKYYWGPFLKSLVVADPGERRMADALLYTERSLKRLETLSQRAGFTYNIYLLVPVQDIIRGSYGDTLNAINAIAPKPVIPTAQLFLESPQAFYYAYDGHINSQGSRRIGEYLVTLDVTGSRSN